MAASMVAVTGSRVAPVALRSQRTQLRPQRPAQQPARKHALRVQAQGGEYDVRGGDGIGNMPSGEWPENISLLAFEDVVKHIERPKVAKKQAEQQVFINLSDLPSREGNRSGDVIAPLPAGEWPENFSILAYEDVVKNIDKRMFKANAHPSESVGQVMSRELKLTSKDTPLASLANAFGEVSGLPVVESDGTIVGVLSKKDCEKPGAVTVADAMTSPAITVAADAKVAIAAALMLKNKIWRVPVVDSANRCIGVVTRTDIFTALLA